MLPKVCITCPNELVLFDINFDFSFQSSNYPWTTDSDGALGCISEFTPVPGTTVLITVEDSDSAGGSTFPVTRSIASGVKGFIQADDIEIRFQVTDLESKSTSISITPIASITSISVTPTASVTSSILIKIPSGGLSTGLKVGIGFGVPLFVALCAIAVGIFLYLRRRKPAAHPGRDKLETMTDVHDSRREVQLELEGSNASGAMDSSRTYELDCSTPHASNSDYIEGPRAPALAALK